MRLDRALRQPEVLTAVVESVALLTAAEVSLALRISRGRRGGFAPTLEFTDS